MNISITNLKPSSIDPLGISPTEALFCAYRLDQISHHKFECLVSSAIMGCFDSHLNAAIQSYKSDFSLIAGRLYNDIKALSKDPNMKIKIGPYERFKAAVDNISIPMHFPIFTKVDSLSKKKFELPIFLQDYLSSDIKSRKVLKIELCETIIELKKYFKVKYPNQSEEKLLSFLIDMNELNPIIFYYFGLKSLNSTNALNRHLSRTTRLSA